MKTDGLKKLIKEAVREAIQEELKDILLEAVRTPKQVVRESFSPTTVSTPTPTFTQPTMDARKAYADVMNETMMSFTSKDAQVPFRPQVSDPVNGNLGAGEVGMDQIMSLLNSK
jgi:small-conductance mechanosensitive channel